MSIRRLILVFATVLFLVPGVLGAADVPGVTDTEVAIGCTTPLSGPAALWGTTGMGMKAWADYINDKGGIHGRKIKFVMKDDAYNPTRGLANLQEMKGNVLAVCGVLGTAILNASKDFYEENKIPLITAYADVRIWEQMPKDKLKYVFIAYPDYGDEAEYLTKYALNKLGSKKIALFYQNDDYGKHAMEGLKKGLAAEPGKAELVGTVPYEITERALGTHALKMKETGADTVMIYTTPTHGALILKEMHKIGYKPKALTTFTLGDPVMYKAAGEVWEGTYIALPGNSGLPGSDPASDKVVEILEKVRPKN